VLTDTPDTVDEGGRKSASDRRRLSVGEHGGEASQTIMRIIYTLIAAARWAGPWAMACGSPQGTATPSPLGNRLLIWLTLKVR